jgi:rRNA pseudouridine-1189 N-methylase Emg1 (Nep1/Mra1 family)
LLTPLPSVQLLERKSISGEGNSKLLETLNPPIKQYLPENALKLGKNKKI